MAPMGLGFRRVQIACPKTKLQEAPRGGEAKKPKKTWREVPSGTWNSKVNHSFLMDANGDFQVFSMLKIWFIIQLKQTIYKMVGLGVPGSQQKTLSNKRKTVRLFLKSITKFLRNPFFWGGQKATGRTSPTQLSHLEFETVALSWLVAHNSMKACGFCR